MTILIRQRSLCPSPHFQNQQAQMNGQDFYITQVRKNQLCRTMVKVLTILQFCSFTACIATLSSKHKNSCQLIVIEGTIMLLCPYELTGFACSLAKIILSGKHKTQLICPVWQVLFSSFG